jgi:hypothetical protein
MHHLKSILVGIYQKYMGKYEICQLDKYRKLYNSYSFDYKIKMANKWLIHYPEQAHFDIIPINYWLENIVTRPASVLEIGGWRGDLAQIALSSFDHIKLWHNYDLIPYNNYQKCYDIRYNLITLKDYLWHSSLKFEYNSLIATHMIEHINWKEFTDLAKWIPASVKTVLFEAPLGKSEENFNWKGDYSSHVLEKGWDQVIAEMRNYGFIVEHREANTVIFKR